MVPKRNLLAYVSSVDRSILSHLQFDEPSHDSVQTAPEHEPFLRVHRLVVAARQATEQTQVPQVQAENTLQRQRLVLSTQRETTRGA